MGWFYELNNTRQSGMNGPLPIPYTEIGKWAELTNKIIYPFEVEIIKKLDNAYLNFSRQKYEKNRNKNKGNK